MPVPAVSAVIVNYRTARHLRPALEALAKASSGAPVEAIVACAASPDRDEARAATLAAPVAARFIELEANRGFAASANRGAAEAASDILLFLNPDARPGASVLARLVERLEALGAGAVAPRLVDARGRHQTGDAGERPSVTGAIEQAFALPRLLGGSRGVFVGESPKAPREVGWLSAAFLLVRREAFRAAGGFDESFFLFGEDVDLGERLRRAGSSSWYVPDLEVLHEGGASYRENGSISPLEGRWALGLRQAHARTGAGTLARGAFAFALGAGLFGRAFAYGLGLSPRSGDAPWETRTKARRLLLAARAALLPGFPGHGTARAS